MATAWRGKARPWWVQAAATSSMPLRVSAVAPDLLVTRTRVCGEVEAGEGAVDAVGVGVVEDVEAAAEGVGEQLRAEGGAADADEEDRGEALAVGGGDGAARDGGGEAVDLVPAGVDLGGDAGLGGALGGAQPVVADAAVLVGVGDRAGLEALHRGQGGAQARGRGLEVGGLQAGVGEVELEGGGVEDDAPGEVLREGRHGRDASPGGRERGRALACPSGQVGFEGGTTRNSRPGPGGRSAGSWDRRRRPAAQSRSMSSTL
jgi:hypothetical protein